VSVGKRREEGGGGGGRGKGWKGLRNLSILFLDMPFSSPPVSGPSRHPRQTRKEKRKGKEKEEEKKRRIQMFSNRRKTF
jgi:hypothetical protein